MSVVSKESQISWKCPSGDGIDLDPEKIAAVKTLPTPTNVTDVRAFVGLVSYYRRHIEGCSGITKPLTDLTKKDRPFIWGDEQKKAFETLKQKSIEYPVLAPPVQEGRYIIDTDASNYAMGAVLQQEQDRVVRVIAYASKIFNSAQRQYCTTRKGIGGHNLRLEGIPALRGGKNSFPAQSRPLSADFTLQDTVPMMQTSGYLNFLASFNFEIQHRPGLQHGNSDAMSRRPCSDKKFFRDGCLGRNHDRPGTDDQTGQDGFLSRCSRRGPYCSDVNGRRDNIRRDRSGDGSSRSLRKGRGYLNPDLMGNKEFASKRKSQQKTNGPRTKPEETVAAGESRSASLANRSQLTMECRTGNRLLSEETENHEKIEMSPVPEPTSCPGGKSNKSREKTS